MKNYANRKYLPLVVAGLGAVTAAARWLLYATALDHRLLLPENHPLQWLILGLTVFTCVLTALSLVKLGGSNHYGKNFSPSWMAALGAVVAAGGIVYTVLIEEVPRGGMFPSLWCLLGLLSIPCFLWAGCCRLTGKKPFFLVYVLICLFQVFHLLNNYQYWSSIPQTMDFLYSLLACICLMLFAYHQAAFCVGSGARRMQLFMGLCAGFFSIVALSGTDYPLLYCGCGAWALTNLCSLTPPPNSKPKQESEDSDAAA